LLFQQAVTKTYVFEQLLVTDPSRKKSADFEQPDFWVKQLAPVCLQMLLLAIRYRSHSGLPLQDACPALLG